MYGYLNKYILEYMKRQESKKEKLLLQNVLKHHKNETFFVISIHKNMHSTCHCNLICANSYSKIDENMNEFSDGQSGFRRHDDRN